jgi:hypothetical protein
VNALLHLVRDLLLLRRGPQDVPYAPGLLAAALLATMAIDALTGHLQVAGGLPFGVVAFSALALIGLPAIALRFAGRAERWMQTATALALTGVAFKLLVVPLLLGIGRLPEQAAAMAPHQTLLGLVALLLLVAQTVVKGHIFRHALDVPLRGGVLLAISFLMIELVLGVVLFGARPA